jgi:phenylalanyl-tRNA synthetase alpha chain
MSSEIALEIEKIRGLVVEAVKTGTTLELLNECRVAVFGKKGAMTGLQRMLGKLSAAERPEAGKIINAAKVELTSMLDTAIEACERKLLTEAEMRDRVDVTQPASGRPLGGFHPVMQVMMDVLEVLEGLGFVTVQGPEVETDFYNFEALNIPPHHPARDMQDTFYFGDGRLLRTHTSGMQIHSMLDMGAPLRIACPGRVYRRDNDPTHSPMFHQVEGLVVDKNISVGDLKGCLEAMMEGIFGKKLKARYRASYFPFTEPSLEVDIECFKCSGSDPHCQICKGTGWLEIGGMGIVHPNVLRYGGIDPEKYTGFAWGMGLDRIAMLKYGLTDLRALFDGDVSYLLSGRHD